MQPSRRAVIDVGTNSIKLLVADVAGRDVQPVHEEAGKHVSAKVSTKPASC